MPVIKSTAIRVLVALAIGYAAYWFAGMAIVWMLPAAGRVNPINAMIVGLLISLAAGVAVGRYAFRRLSPGTA